MGIEIGSLILELLSLPDFAFKHPTNIRQDDDCLDCNPQTVQKQISVKQKRNKEENAKKSETKKQILRITEPVLSQKNGQSQIKTINLKKMVKSEKNKKRKRKKSRDRRKKYKRERSSSDTDNDRRYRSRRDRHRRSRRYRSPSYDSSSWSRSKSKSPKPTKEQRSRSRSNQID